MLYFQRQSSTPSHEDLYLDHPKIDNELRKRSSGTDLKASQQVWIYLKERY